MEPRPIHPILAVIHAKNPRKLVLDVLYYLVVKTEVEESQKPANDFENRIAPLDAKLANLDARIERNKAELARTNAQLTLKIAEMLKRLGSGR